MLVVLHLGAAATSTEPMATRNFLKFVRANNNAAEAAASARPFLVGGQAIGRVLAQSAGQLSRFPEVFDVTDRAVRLRDEAGACVETRSEAVAYVLGELRAEGNVPMLAGWRDEKLAARASFFSKPLLLVERAAAGIFGFPAYGVFVNGFTAAADDATPTALWLGRRAANKPTWPGLLDCLAAGGVSAGKLPTEAMQEECREEASMPEELIARVRPAGGVCYTSFDESGWALKRDVLYCFDLHCPSDFQPLCMEGEECGLGEVGEFKLMTIEEVATLLAQGGEEFKPNVGVVIVDFLMRHGLVVTPNDPDYLELLAELRNAECR
mmetsp:Transcript_59742/g.137037  ORF Transcript_59742/g.137037 Transcript_59742/m.137037 type:complete len:324 (-) Transcript_59742:152-1123(-)